MEIKTPPKTHAYAHHICRAWYNGSYTMATKPIKFLELHYTMTQLLIILITSLIGAIKTYYKTLKAKSKPVFSREAYYGYC